MGVQIPAEIRWLGGARVRARFQEKKEGASSVVAAVLGEATFSRLCRYGVRLLGVKHDVDAYEEVRPNAFCSRCSGWGHIAPHCTRTIHATRYLVDAAQNLPQHSPAEVTE